MWFADELSHIVQKASIKVSSIAKTLTSLFDGTSGANITKEDNIEIDNFQLSILACTTGENYVSLAEKIAWIWVLQSPLVSQWSTG